MDTHLFNDIFSGAVKETVWQKTDSPDQPIAKPHINAEKVLSYSAVITVVFENSRTALSKILTLNGAKLNISDIIEEITEKNVIYPHMLSDEITAETID